MIIGGADGNKFKGGAVGWYISFLYIILLFKLLCLLLHNGQFLLLLNHSSIHSLWKQWPTLLLGLKLSHNNLIISSLFLNSSKHIEQLFSFVQGILLIWSYF